MSTRGIPKKSARLFRITHGVFGVLFGGIAAWLFATSRSPVVACIFAVAALIALIHAIIGWQPSRE
jgi:succinate dehydrogenase hydrophobic anchor subunit